MTACAMIVGMVPMSLALEAGSQMQAPLGRAVIGGLLVSTFATLLILPAVFALVMGRSRYQSPSLHPDDPESKHHHPERRRETTIRRPDRGDSHAYGRSIRRDAPAWTAGSLRPRRPGGRLLLTRRRRPSRSTSSRTCAWSRPEQRTIARTVGQPGFINAYEQTSIYPKVAGYVQEWNVDIGDRIKKDQEIATLSVPELPAELKQKQGPGRAGRGADQGRGAHGGGGQKQPHDRGRPGGRGPGQRQQVPGRQSSAGSRKSSG